MAVADIISEEGKLEGKTEDLSFVFELSMERRCFIF